MEKEERYLRRDSYINKAFELTYASWLVLPRTYLMDMPTEWQNKFVKLLDEYNESINDLSPNEEYNIVVNLKYSGKFCKMPRVFANYKHPNHMDVCDIRCFSKNTLKA